MNSAAYRLIELRFYIPPDAKCVISETFFTADHLARYYWVTHESSHAPANWKILQHKKHYRRVLCLMSCLKMDWAYSYNFVTRTGLILYRRQVYHTKKEIRPVCSHPSSSITSRVAASLFKYPFMICGPRTQSSPRWLGPRGFAVSKSITCRIRQQNNTIIVCHSTYVSKQVKAVIDVP